MVIASRSWSKPPQSTQVRHGAMLEQRTISSASETSPDPPTPSLAGCATAVPSESGHGLAPGGAFRPLILMMMKFASAQCASRRDVGFLANRDQRPIRHCSGLRPEEAAQLEGRRASRGWE